MKNAVGTLFLLAGTVIGAWLFWQWGVCRFYVPPDHLAVIVTKTGRDLPPGKILADPEEKGIQKAVLGEGRYFLNPVTHERRILPIIEIPAGKVGVVTSKVGEDLPAGDFLAEPDQKGIWRRVLGPGKYRMNPFGYEIEIVDAISIPIGYVGVVTSLAGRQSGESGFAAVGEKGVREDVLQPGLYYINPRQYKIDVLEIGLNQVSLLGREGGEVVTKSLRTQQGGQAVEELQRNVLLEQAARRASYLADLRAMEKAPAKSSSLRRSGAATDDRSAMQEQGAALRTPAGRPEVDALSTFTLNEYVEFPSRDGFEISLDMTVEFELLPSRIAGIFRAYGDLPAVVEKIIMPQILSISRLKGSAYRAVEFVMGEGRERFQTDLTDTLSHVLAERNIQIHNALIRHVNVPRQILEPIQQASIAGEQNQTNQVKQETARKLAELNRELSLIAQRGEQVQQETEKIRAEIQAEQEKQVAQIAAETARRVAEIEWETAEIRAETRRIAGRAEAEVVRRVEGEKARGYQMKIQAFGDSAAFALHTFARGLSSDLRVAILHAGTGTLWTDLEKAGLGDLGGARILQKP